MVILLGLDYRHSSRKLTKYRLRGCPVRSMAVGYNGIRISIAKITTLALLRMTWHQGNWPGQ